MLLPGQTSHGHYQIELACNACHTPNMGVKQDACLDCHQEELKLARDTHPAKKFNDPTNAERLQVLDAQKCITCHREHVPDRTHPMGLSLPTDYCYHCHKDVMEERPSHANFAFNSCATAGCHNYHDNRALYENFLKKHMDEPDVFDNPHIAAIAELEETKTPPNAEEALTAEDQDAPADHQASGQLLHDWSETLHAKAGVNCTACHVESEETGWEDKVSHETCAKCHKSEVAGWLQGRHGMRVAQGLPPMTPAEARLPMKSARAHEQLDCSSCHGGHRFDTRAAAVDACLTCHNDDHSRAYQKSSHFTLWQDEVAGQGNVGTGVSCATCHMPRCENENGESFVQHNQNDNLRPNEKMIRSVCINCHGVGFSIDALADGELIEACFAGQAKDSVDSLKMVKEWFESRTR
jgi:formate-dependent nitrite reductase cytochrome c552 subunit